MPEVLKKSYIAVKAGDPNAKLTMCGSHTIDQWQKQLYEMETAERDPRYKVYQDTLATHLYPNLQGIEPTLRQWLDKTLGDEALKAKGQLMTESGWPVFQINVQNLFRRGLLPQDYSGELDVQCYMAMYAPVLLGEHLKIGAKLHGVHFFRAFQTMLETYLFDEGGTDESGFEGTGEPVPDRLRVGGCGHFTNRWNSEQITLARPPVFTHNTLARLLTHDVQHADVDIEWDKSIGRVESYAFRRPGETIVAVWIGAPDDWQHQPRAERIPISIRVPDDAGLVLLADINGNEQQLHVEDGGLVRHTLTRPADVRDAEGNILYLRTAKPEFVRFIDGQRIGNVFVRSPSHGFPGGAAKRARVVEGTPETNSDLVAEISNDRDLPVINDQVPQAGSPLVLFSDANDAVYLIGRSAADVGAARAAYEDLRD